MVCRNIDQGITKNVFEGTQQSPDLADKPDLDRAWDNLKSLRAAVDDQCPEHRDVYSASSMSWRPRYGWPNCSLAQINPGAGRETCTERGQREATSVRHQPCAQCDRPVARFICSIERPTRLASIP